MASVGRSFNHLQNPKNQPQIPGTIERRSAEVDKTDFL
ncbi:hypothetical protein SynBIOSE41_03767 [Synechococcus sp. BIOS-E4-1]|nr:hypothetical protein SynBIOSE41_03767 [Synechococcus sp. BIOS-E4-1]